MSNIVKVICVGTDPQLLESRCLELQAAGFEASGYLPLEALNLVCVKTFDMMILSANVSDEDRSALAAAAPDRIRLIQLHGLISPQQLLTVVGSPSKEPPRLK